MSHLCITHLVFFSESLIRNTFDPFDLSKCVKNRFFKKFELLIFFSFLLLFLFTQKFHLNSSSVNTISISYCTHCSQCLTHLKYFE